MSTAPDSASTMSPAGGISSRESALHPHLPRADRVLDCRCGPRERVEALRALGAREVIGIAPSPEAAAEAAGWYDQVLELDLFGDALPFETGALDAIVCHDVLARMRDAEPVVEKLRPLLKDSGVLVASVPNIQYHPCFMALIEGHWDYVEEGPLARAHLRFFTGAELLRLLQRKGFEVARTSALQMDPPEAFPRGEDQMVHAGRISVGPLTENEYRTYLVKEFVFTAHPAQT